jgi:hypothetical protein
LDSSTVEIESIEIIAAPDNMVDITVEDDHTYWCSPTGENWYLTHNTSWPDIDSDAGDRDALINAARKLYGEDAVIPVSNFNTLKLLSLVKDISKFYGINFQEVNKMTSGLQREVEPQDRDPNEEKSVYVLTHEACMQYSSKYLAFMSKYPEVKDHIETLFMQNRSMGRHAGGVIIAPPEQLEKTMPIVKVRGDLQTPWTEGMNFRNLEDNGFIKFDFLGLTLMKDVENCIRRILQKKGKKSPNFADIRNYFDRHLNCRYVAPDDPKVFETAFHADHFAPGIFQFTQCLEEGTAVAMSNGQRRCIEDVKIGEFVFSYDTKTDQFVSREVLDVIDNGDLECLELELENGKTITCTYDHKFYTSNRGWVEAQYLTEDDDIVDFAR